MDINMKSFRIKYLSAFFFIAFSVFTTSIVYAQNEIEPYALLCTTCGGRMSTVVRTETQSYYHPCRNGYGGTKDILEREYDYTYLECEDCSNRVIKGNKLVYEQLRCMATGEVIYEGYF